MAVAACGGDEAADQDVTRSPEATGDAGTETTAESVVDATTADSLDSGGVETDGDESDPGVDAIGGDSMLERAVLAGEALIASLSDDQLDTVLYDHGDGAIVSSWFNLPACETNGRAGIRHGDLSDEQIEAVYEVVAAVLSDAGALEYRQIIAADEELGGSDGDV